jgi:hypothetical protein
MRNITHFYVYAHTDRAIVQTQTQKYRFLLLTHRQMALIIITHLQLTDKKLLEDLQ